jgi:hypothetical protein
MRLRTFLPAVFVVVAAPAAWAQSSPPAEAAEPASAPAASVEAEAEAPAAAPAPGVVLGYGAMPGGQLTAAAQPVPAGQVGLAAFGSFGFRDELLGAGHRYTRSGDSLSLAYSPLRLLTLGLTIDGRYDSHSGAAVPDEDGYVGDPRLLVRVAAPAGPVSLGAQARVWFPGNDAPSVDFGATTVELRALASFAAGPTTLSLNGGYRLDRSGKSVEHPEKLSREDQVSLGVSNFDAAVASAMVFVPLGRAFVGVEGGADLFLGSGHPDPTFRGLLSGGVRLGGATSLVAFVQYARVAELAMDANPVPLIPYDPAFNFGLGFEGRFGGGAAGGAAPRKPYVVTDTPKDKPAPVVRLAAVSGTVLDDAGAPVVGAKVTVTTEKKTGNAVTDARGKYKIGELSVGPATIDIEVANKKPQQLSLTLVEGANPAPQVQLDPVLPPGELRGNVRGRAGGRAIAGAKIVVTPGDYAATSGPDGTFALTLPPGKYTMTTTADGFAPQVIEAVVDQEGVTVKFVNLDKK